MKNLAYFALLFLFLSACTENGLNETGQLVPQTVDEDATLPSIFVNNTQLHAETFGDPNDPMLVMIHGGPGADYRSLLKCQAFASDSFFVVFYDQRGSGLSKRHHADIYNTQLFIDDLEAVINYYQKDNSQKIMLMGHSWGAMLATAFVNDYPERVDGVVLIEPGGFTWEDTKKYISRAFELELFSETTNDQVYVDQFITGHDHNVLDYKAGLSSAIENAPGNKVGNAGPYPEWRTGAICNRAAIDYVEEHPFDFTTNLEEYNSKVLFAYSALSAAYGKEHAELVSSAYPNVDLVKIENTGHEIVYFGWDNFYPIAKAYLKERR